MTNILQIFVFGLLIAVTFTLPLERNTGENQPEIDGNFRDFRRIFK